MNLAAKWFVEKIVLYNIWCIYAFYKWWNYSMTNETSRKFSRWALSSVLPKGKFDWTFSTHFSSFVVIFFCKERIDVFREPLFFFKIMQEKIVCKFFSKALENIPQWLVVACNLTDHAKLQCRFWKIYKHILEHFSFDCIKSIANAQRGIQQIGPY